MAGCTGPELNLAMLSLGALPESVAELAHLQHLNVMGTNLDKVPAKLGKLPSLVSLNLESCKLKALEGIGQLESLTALNARSNQITALPDELCAMPALLSLDLGENPLGQLPEGLGSIETLEFLRLDGTGLSALPPSLYGLANLRHLALNDNELSEVPEGLARLDKLAILKLAGNQLSTLPTELASLQDLVSVELKGCPMRCPPQEICEQGALAIRGFLQDLEVGGATCNCLDVVFLGSPGAGQDNAVQNLFGDAATLGRTASTAYGANISTWSLGTVDVDGVGPVEDMHVRTMCFPGDDVSHAAYQMLMHRRCLFVVVVDLSEWSADNHDRLVQRWVRDIRSRVPTAKIMFVGTGLLTEREERSSGSELAACVKQFERDREAALERQLGRLRKIIDERELKRKANSGQAVRARGWRAMRGTVATSAKRNEEQCERMEQQLACRLHFLNDAQPLRLKGSSGEGIEDLRKAVIGSMPEFLHIGATVPSRYVDLQRIFEEQQATASGDQSAAGSVAIYWNDFKIQAGHVGIVGPEPVRRSAQYLTLVGTVLHVAEDAALKPFVFVDPARLCEVFTHIAHDNGFAQGKHIPDGAEPTLREGIEKLRTSGALNRAVRQELGSQLGLEDHIMQLVLSMMSRIGMLAERPSESEALATKAGASSMALLSTLSAMTATDVIVPSLLPEFPMTSLADSWGGPWASAWPSELAEQAETGRPRLNLQLRRVYVQCERALADGSTSSMSIFGCALSRLMQRLAAEPVQLWQTGACMAVQKELGAQGARVLVEQRVDSKVDGRRQAVLTLTLRSTAEALIGGQLAAVWGRMDECVRSAAEQQPGIVLSSYIACPLCQAKGIAPYLFTTTEIAEAWRDGERSRLSPGLAEVPLELLQPPSPHEAADADQGSDRARRVRRVMQQLETHLTDRTSSEVASADEQEGGRRNVQLTPQQRDNLGALRQREHDRYSLRMHLFKSDALELIAAGMPTAFAEYQKLIARVLNRSYISDWAFIEKERRAEARRAAVLAGEEVSEEEDEEEEEEEEEGTFGARSLFVQYEVSRQA